MSVTTFAQDREQMRERIQAQKIAFITEKLSLTTEEAQSFWPIYNTYEATVNTIKSKDLRAIKMEMRNDEGVSDKRANELLESLIEAEEKTHAAKLKLVRDLKQVIPAKKIIQLKGAEDQFNRMLLERLKEFRENRKKRN
jgi:hypothetical protein